MLKIRKIIGTFEDVRGQIHVETRHEHYGGLWWVTIAEIFQMHPRKTDSGTMRTV